MANTIREALNAAGMRLILYTGGTSKVGFNIAGTWVGKASFWGAPDGLAFRQVSVTPFASGTAVQSVTANGSWEIATANYLAYMVQLDTLTSGTPLVTMGASLDSSYQDVFLASTSIFVSQEVSAGATNVITQAAQANRAWRLRTLTGAFSVAAAATVALSITDGASSVIWKTYVPLAAGPWQVTLPPDDNTPGRRGGGVVGTAGNSMVITLAAPGGSVVSELNAEFCAA
jgi:hypothetical protein